MFDDKSRYKNVKTYQVQDSRGRIVTVVPITEFPNQTTLGFHLLKQGQRIDHLSAGYLKNAAGFWRICELNNVMLPDALAERLEIAIPEK